MLSFHDSTVGWTVSRTNGYHCEIFRVVTAGGMSRASGIACAHCAGLPSLTAGYLNLLYCSMARHKVSGSAEMRGERSEYGRNMK
jgi:hypothetical protein